MSVKTPPFKHKRLNPIKILENDIKSGALKIKGEGNIKDFIIYDKDVNKNYHIMICTQFAHDTTLAFYIKAYGDILNSVLSCFQNNVNVGFKKGTLPPLKQNPDKKYTIKYYVGDMHICEIYGKVKIAGGLFPGARTRIYLPVRTEIKEIE
jgi:hypothetical protein